MAAFAQASRAPTPSRARQSHAPTLSHTQTLPSGSCNFRDLSIFGVNAPPCGCRRFYRNPDRPDDGDIEYPWCVCGHHFCFHDPPDNAAASAPRSQCVQQAPSTSAELVQVGDGVYVERSRLDHANQDIYNTPRRRGKFTRSLSGDTTVEGGEHAVQRWAPAGTRPANARSSSSSRKKANPSLHMSGFPSVPSICQFNSGDLRAMDFDGSANRNADRQPSQPQQRVAVSRQPSTDRSGRTRATETEALREWHRQVAQRREQSQLASTRYSTEESDRPRNSPSRVFLDHVLQSRRAAAEADAAPILVKAEEHAQSATQLATPSLTEAPDVQGYDRHLQETTSLIDKVVQEIASAETTGAGADELELSLTQPNTSQLSLRTARAGTPSTRDESIPASGSRNVHSAVRNLAPQLLALKKHLATQPNISTTIKNMCDRLWMLENASFQHVPAEEVLEKFEQSDLRVLDVEYRLASLQDQSSTLEERVQAAIAQLDEDAQSFIRRDDYKDDLINTNEAFAKLEERYSIMDQRLRELEVSVPSPAYPWEIEVVLLPWGRNLRGIWYSQSELLKLSRYPEGRRSRGSSTSLLGTKNTTHGNSSDDEAYNLQDREDLLPRACTTKSKVWARLKSRGFIKNITITEPGARHILTTIGNVFGADLCKAAGDCSELPDEEVQVHGLRAPVIPLRKIPKDKQLLFLPDSERVTPTLWTADFLSSDIIHHVGGKKRLWATSARAYLQPQRPRDQGLTWEDIQNMPRVDVDSSTTEEAQAPEAEERCWDWDERFDPLLGPFSLRNIVDNSDASANLSFNSSASQPLPYRDAQPEQLVSDSEPTSLAQEQEGSDGFQSEVTPRQHRRLNRTVSAPTTQTTTTAISINTSKRRAASELDYHDTSPPYTPTTSVSYARRNKGKKRRRTSRSRRSRSANSDAASPGCEGAKTYAEGFDGGLSTPPSSAEPEILAPPPHPHCGYMSGRREGSFGFFATEGSQPFSQRAAAAAVEEEEPADRSSSSSSSSSSNDAADERVRFPRATVAAAASKEAAAREVYPTPFSNNTGGANRAYPSPDGDGDGDDAEGGGGRDTELDVVDQGAERGSDTEPDDVGDEDDNNSDGDDVKRRDGGGGGSGEDDDEMTDADVQSDSQVDSVDYIHRPDSPVKQERLKKEEEEGVEDMDIAWLRYGVKHH